MVILLDGYNILKQIIKTDFATQQQQTWFIQFLVKYAKMRNHRIILVFDGGPYRRPTITVKEPLRIVYSGERESADDYIKTIAAELQDKQVLVVSSDRALTRFLAHLAIPSIDALDFYKLVQERMTQTQAPVRKSTGQIHKTARDEPENPELDVLMHEGSTILMHKDSTSMSDYREKQEKVNLTKQEKKLYHILKKI